MGCTPKHEVVFSYETSGMVLGQGAYVYLMGTFLIPTAALPRCYITAVDSNQKLWLFYSEDDFRYSANNTEYFTIWASIFEKCRSMTMSGCADQQMESSCSKSQVCFEALDCMKPNNCRGSGITLNLPVKNSAFFLKWVRIKCDKMYRQMKSSTQI